MAGYCKRNCQAMWKGSDVTSPEPFSCVNCGAPGGIQTTPLRAYPLIRSYHRLNAVLLCLQYIKKRPVIISNFTLWFSLLDILAAIGKYMLSARTLNLPQRPPRGAGFGITYVLTSAPPRVGYKPRWANARCPYPFEMSTSMRYNISIYGSARHGQPAHTNPQASPKRRKRRPEDSRPSSPASFVGTPK